MPPGEENLKRFLKPLKGPRFIEIEIATFQNETCERKKLSAVLGVLILSRPRNQKSDQNQNSRQQEKCENWGPVSPALLFTRENPLPGRVEDILRRVFDDFLGSGPRVGSHKSPLGWDAGTKKALVRQGRVLD